MPNTLHERVLEFMLEYRESNPSFKFWLRQRDKNNRLTDGLWFQGTEGYTFVGLYNRGGGTNMTRSFGVSFWQGENSILDANLEIVWNEEKDADIINFYQKSMALLGGFVQKTATKYVKYLGPNNIEKHVIDFFENDKPKIDRLIKELDLADIMFIDETKFNDQLSKIISIKNNLKNSMLSEVLIKEIKDLFANFKETIDYTHRENQAEFIPFGKELIKQLLLKPSITNYDLTGLIQILKAGSGNHIANRYLPVMFEDDLIAGTFINSFENLSQKGYTGAGKNGITRLNKAQLAEVKSFLSNAFNVKTIDEAVTLCNNYDNLNIPEVKKGVYSPWLFYISPELFPIINNKHLQFLDWVEVSHKYSESIKLFNELSTILDADLGILDAFIYFMEFDNDFEEDIKPIPMPLNTILYGPPGTGKTYHTINKAVEIANPGFVANNREELKQEYQRLRDEGQILFTTFHQSLSYEDFIEGIKPVLIDSDNELETINTPINYKIEPGIFFDICKKARYQPDVQIKRFHISKEEFNKTAFFKISLGNTLLSEDDEIYDYCIKNNCIALGWGGSIDYSNLNEAETKKKAIAVEKSGYAITAINHFINYLKKGNYVLVSNGNNSCRAIGKVTGDYYFEETDEIDYCQFRKVEWLVKDVDIPVSEIYHKSFSQQSIYKLDNQNIKLDFFVKNAEEIRRETSSEPKNYVMIIDEINRGNVSQIFGEIITLIEDDKRECCPEALEVILPYSKKSFSVPPNLYIIGTMNTADRSVEALDTALRRRFSFIEMLPQGNHIDIIDLEDIDLKEVLKIVNSRLEKLLSRDHMIGHSFFIGIDTIEKLYNAFYNKIIPQLQEYFFGDYGKIGLVLGKAFFERDSLIPKVSFADFEYEDKDLLLEKKVYRIKNFISNTKQILEDEFLDAVKAIV